MNIADQKYDAFARLVARGAKSARVSYSGGNDSGGVDEIVLTMLDGSTQHLNMHSEYSWKTRGTVDLTPEQLEENTLFDLLSKPVYDEWYTFAGEFYVNGVYVWDAENNKVTKSQDVDEPRTKHFDEEW